MPKIVRKLVKKIKRRLSLFDGEPPQDAGEAPTNYYLLDSNGDQILDSEDNVMTDSEAT